jgi:two-component system, NtrC family, sensor kinase
VSESPSAAPVFDAMLDKAMHLCGAAFGILWTYDGEWLQAAAIRGATAEYAHFLASAPHKPGSENAHGRLLRGERFVHIADVEADAAYRSDDPIRRATVELGGARTLLAVPLRKDGAFLGDVVIYRRHVELFSDKQIALLQNFAAQAVIAMENTRLITETREALEQQTATAEVLQVINSSPGNLEPVYDVILEKARSLCDVPIGGLMLYDGHLVRTVALHGLPEQFLDEAVQPFPPGSAVEKLIRGDRFLHIPDYMAFASQAVHPATRALVEMGVRTTLAVPLRKEGTLLGLIAANRLEMKPFSEKEIALLENFAAQAVIAMDNARLLNEIRQRQAELRVTFDNMGDGVAMFDSELRLAAWNLNFQKILDLPDELLEERLPYADYIRFLAQRGEYGSADIEAELSRRLEGLGQESRFEHTKSRRARHRSAPQCGAGRRLCRDL